VVFTSSVPADIGSFLAIFTDVATIAIAYDRAPYARQPVEWQLPKVWIISTIMGEFEVMARWRG
jgi:H+-transporting ATPase